MKYASFLKVTAATAAIVAGSSAAFAADAPVYDKGVVAAPVVVASPLWQGFYLGAFAGYAWGDVEVSHPTTAGIPYYFTTGDYDLDDTDGFFAGGTIGYNWQVDQFVFGVEGELGHMDISGSMVDPFGAAAGFRDLNVTSNGDFYGAVTARVGFAVDQWLIYAKGGAAFLQASQTYLDNCSFGPACGLNQLWLDNDYEWQTGYTVGGGVEWAMTDNWSAKLEYMYFDFGDEDVTGRDLIFGLGWNGSADRSAHTLKAGLNYRF